MKMVFRRLFFFLFILAITSQIAAQEQSSSRCFIAAGKNGAVSCGHPLATAAAIKVLQNGGNAVDAAVCAGFMLGVVDFSNSGIGGDGFALIRTANGQIHSWDGSIKRPRQMTVKLGEHPLGLPAVPEMLLKILRLYGSRPGAEILAPAIATCRQGFKITSYVENAIEKKLMDLDDQAAIDFLAPEGYPLRSGQLLLQPLLAETLSEMAIDGGQSFYRGELAKRLVADMQKHGSEYQLADMSAYRSQPVKPIKKLWHDYQIFGCPPPASSLATIKLALDLLDSGTSLFRQNAAEIIATAKIGRKVIEAKYSGIAESIKDPEKFNAIADSTPIDSPVQNNADGGTNTTHLCVWDKDGMIVTMTLTLGSHFGTGQYSPGGFFYNNGLRNYSATVGGYPSDYPLNAGPVSAKSPILITRKGKPWLAIGGAGSNRIIFNTALAMARNLSQPHSFSRTVKEPRYFLDYRKKLFVEWNPDAPLLDALKKQFPDTQIKPGCDDYFGLVSAIMASGTNLITIADHRRDGSCAAVNPTESGSSIEGEK